MAPPDGNGMAAEWDVTPEMLDALRAFTRNADWAVDHPEVVYKHVGRWIAVLDERLVAVGDDPAQLHERFRDRRDLYLRFVGPPGRRRVLAVGTTAAQV
jgi:hypothetical protein